MVGLLGIHKFLCRQQYSSSKKRESNLNCNKYVCKISEARCKERGLLLRPLCNSAMPYIPDPSYIIFLSSFRLPVWNHRQHDKKNLPKHIKQTNKRLLLFGKCECNSRTSVSYCHITQKAKPFLHLRLPGRHYTTYIIRIRGRIRPRLAGYQ